MQNEGYVYIISNKNFPGFLKIGITNNISKRLSSYQTSSPLRNYKLEYYVKHPNPKMAEKQIHDTLKYFATNQRKEWFEVELSIAKAQLDASLIPEE